jgi:CBS-domain-containing membrane protein
MTRRDDYMDAMLRHLGATYYQTLHGQAHPSDVAQALDTVEQEAAIHGVPFADQSAWRGRRQPTGRWRVRDVMTTAVIAVGKRALGTQIARLMKQHHIHALPVVSADRKVIGVVSEADLLRTQQRERQRVLARLRGRASFAAGAGAFTAGRLMTSPAITIHPDAPIGAAARHLAHHHLTLLPVADTSGQLLGVVTRRDLLNVFLRSDASIAAEVRDILTEVLLAEPSDVSVSAHEGVVCLAGSVSRRDIAQAAARLAADVDGVLAVSNMLTAPDTAAASLTRTS